MVRCRWSGKAPRPARGCQGAAKRPLVDGCRESRILPRVVQGQDAMGVSGESRHPMLASLPQNEP